MNPVHPMGASDAGNGATEAVAPVPRMLTCRLCNSRCREDAMQYRVCDGQRIAGNHASGLCNFKYIPEPRNEPTEVIGDPKALLWVKLHLDGSWCVMYPEDARDEIFAAEDSSAYRMEYVWMTQEAVDALPEFQGF